MLDDRVALRAASASGFRMRRNHIPVIIRAIALAALLGPPLVSSVARFLPVLVLGFILLVIAQAGETSGLTAVGLSRRPTLLRGRE
jgi:hypothetical protein